jgi:hypothetical protein
MALCFEVAARSALVFFAHRSLGAVHYGPCEAELGSSHQAYACVIVQKPTVECSIANPSVDIVRRNHSTLFDKEKVQYRTVFVPLQ